MILTTSLNNATISGTGGGSGGLTPAQAEMLEDLWSLRGFNPVVNPRIADTSITVGDKVIAIDNTDPLTTVLERQ